MTSRSDKPRLTAEVEEMEEDEDVEVMAEELEDVLVMNDLLIPKHRSSQGLTSGGVTKQTRQGRRT